ncbi:MAG: LysM peptidoglycan-binding domain-containing protein [Lachnospiraceae bacterium]
MAVTIGVMGRQGKLDNLVGEFKSIINGIINDGDEPADGKGIISVNGVPSTTENKETSENTSQETTTQSEETTDDKDNETKEAATEPENVTSGEETTTLPEQQTASVTPAQTNTYMVEKGETLYSICMKLYGNTKNMDTIIELNGLESGDSIYYGKNLIVP